MTTKIWQWVDKPEAGATVLLDMNEAGAVRIDGDKEFSLEAPVLKSVFTESPLVDGAELSSSSYSNRQLIFSLHIDGNTGNQKASRLNKLLSLMSKPGLIKYQLDNTMDPVFFQTFDGDNYKVRPRNKGPWSIDCTVIARPFALGVRKDLPLVTVLNDPSASGVGINPTYWDVQDIIGDARTPGFFKISSINKAVMAWRTKNDPASLNLYAGAENATLGLDTVRYGKDPDASGVGAGSNANPVLNPGFESSNTNWTATAGNIISTGVQSHSGSAGGRYDAVATSGTRVINSANFACPENEPFSAEAWVRVGAGPMTQARVNVRFLNNVGGTISTITGSFVTLSTTFQAATVAGTSPVGTVEAHVRVEGSPDPLAVASHFYMDDVLFSPGNNQTRTTFANNGIIPRITVTLPTSANKEALRGTYRVLVRLKGSAAGSTFNLRYRQNPSGASALGPLVSYPAPATWAVIDLGEIEFPGFPVPESFGHSRVTPEISETQIAIEATRASGSAAMHIDYVYLLPASEGYCGIAQYGVHPWLILDGPGKMPYGMATGADPFGGGSHLTDSGGNLATVYGKIPDLTPDTLNRIFFLRTDSVGPSNQEDIYVSYWPYWKWVPSS